MNFKMRLDLNYLDRKELIYLVTVLKKRAIRLAHHQSYLFMS